MEGDILSHPGDEGVSILGAILLPTIEGHAKLQLLHKGKLVLEMVVFIFTRAVSVDAHPC